MKTHALTLLLGLVCGNAIHAQSPSADRMQAFLDAVEANGCAVPVADARAFFHANDFVDVEERLRLAVALMQDGRVQVSEDGLQIRSDACAVSTPPVYTIVLVDRVVGFAEFLMANDCILILPRQIEILGEAGFEDWSELRTLLTVAVSLGVAEVSDDERDLLAIDGICVRS